MLAPERYEGPDGSLPPPRPVRVSKDSDRNVIRLGYRRLVAQSTPPSNPLVATRETILNLISMLRTGGITPATVLGAFNISAEEKGVIEGLLVGQGSSITLLASNSPRTPENGKHHKPRALDTFLKPGESPFTIVHPTEEQCHSIFRLCHAKLGYEKKTQELLRRQITFEDWSSGWMVSLPKSTDSLVKNRETTLVVPDFKDPSEIMAFLEFQLLGHGIDQDGLKEYFNSIKAGSINPEYRDTIARFQNGMDLDTVALIDMSAVDIGKQESSGYLGIAELLEYQFLYNIFTNHPEILSIISKWMIFPDVNIPTALFHGKRFGVQPIASSSTTITRTNGETQEFEWTVIDHPAFKKLIEKHPKRDITFQEFVNEYKELIPRTES